MSRKGFNIHRKKGLCRDGLYLFEVTSIVSILQCVQGQDSLWSDTKSSGRVISPGRTILKKKSEAFHVLICMQDAEPNDRKIVKLCEYASKNPLQIPKVCFTFWLTHYFAC
ncbi:hypothetical protein Patl1_07165 [Pistacia atlantica]|uniref:Uncharacterized protein n=1 Tax=Pistacia atlantica TaxID=434234 RepID=A0ACC1AJT1_9ROSI|nr:hypothetical protein Patl1_07165 [Pistacia atlantica]